ncbi:MAG: hypothetical protein AAGJ87_10775 [Pseudomonadota bacterium]
MAMGLAVFWFVIGAVVNVIVLVLAITAWRDGELIASKPVTLAYGLAWLAGIAVMSVGDGVAFLFAVVGGPIVSGPTILAAAAVYPQQSVGLALFLGALMVAVWVFSRTAPKAFPRPLIWLYYAAAFGLGAGIVGGQGFSSATIDCLPGFDYRSQDCGRQAP